MTHNAEKDAGRILGSLAVESIRATVEAAETEPNCMCREGAYLGAQNSGDPIRCERCHKVVCTVETRIIAALLTHIEALSAAVDRVRRRHPRGDEEVGFLAPGLWCPTCGRERRDNGYGACDDRQALIVPGLPTRVTPPDKDPIRRMEFTSTATGEGSTHASIRPEQETPMDAEIDALLREAYRRGYTDRAAERDYDPGHALDLLATVVPDGTTGRLLVKRDGGVVVSMTPKEYADMPPIPSGTGGVAPCLCGHDEGKVPDGIDPLALLAERLATLACPVCGQRTLTVEMRLESKPVGSEVPYAVCTSCELSEPINRAEPDA